MPDWSKEIRAAIASLNLDPAREAGVVEELSQHLRDRYEEMLNSGIDPHQAHRTLLAELNDGKLVAGLKATVPHARPPLTAGKDGQEKILPALIADLRYAARLLARNPGFAIVAILSLALGIGANTTIFQLLDAVRLRTLPVKHAEQLATISLDWKGGSWSGNFPGPQHSFTTGIWNALSQQQRAFSSAAAWSEQYYNLGQGGEVHNADTLMVSGSFFQVLDMIPAAGRLLSPADDYRGCGAQAAVISYAFWQKQFGGRADTVGSRLTLGGFPFQIIGVTPGTFHGIEIGHNYDVAIPLCSEPAFHVDHPWSDQQTTWWLSGIGRLQPGVSFKEASAQLNSIAGGIFASTMPSGYDDVARKAYLLFGFTVAPGASGTSELRGQYEDPLWILLALSALVLLIACANLANLMLARASQRQREMALRLTLGASRTRLIRQLLAESLLLAFIGTLSGVVLAQILSRVLIAFLSTHNNQLFVELSPDWRILGFAAGLAILTCVLFGLAPAIQSSRTDPGAVMKAGSRGMTAGRERFMLRRILVISQVALSLVLLTGALLFVRTFRKLATINAGFTQDHVLVADFNYSALRLPVAGRGAYQQQLLAQIRAIPGVTAAASTTSAPLSGSSWNDIVDIPALSIQRKLTFFYRISPGYFQTMQTPLIGGRDFAVTDTLTAPKVAIVNEAFVQTIYGGKNPIGGLFRESDAPDRAYLIVGLVKNNKVRNLREEFQPIAYLSDAQDPAPGLDTILVIRSNEPLLPLIASIKRESDRINPVMVLEFTVMQTQIKDGLLRERLMATLSGFFGVLAAVLATIGLYGVISYMVLRRGNEIGIRMALGANRSRILIMVLREAGILLVIGLAAGTALSLAAGREASTLLYGLKATDPLTLGTSILGLAFVAILASLLPAQRAATVHPMVALREE